MTWLYAKIRASLRWLVLLMSLWKRHLAKGSTTISFKRGFMLQEWLLDLLIPPLVEVLF